MGIQLSVTVRNARLDSIETAVGVSPKLSIWDGAIPADCSVASAGNKLAEAVLPSDWMANASTGSKAKSGTWSATGIVAGLARYWRIFDSTNTTCHAQGLCSEPWAGSKAYVLNQQVNNGGNVYKVTTAGTSNATGGPTGTGTGIVDSGVTWAYVGTADLIFDNTNIALNQALSISTFTLTDGNA